MFAGELSPRVVITGMGTVNPLGNSVNDSWPRLVNGESGIVKVKYRPSSIEVAGKIQGLNSGEIIAKLPPTFKIKKQRGFSSAVIFALSATHEALENAQLLDGNRNIIPDIDKNEFGAILGTGAGGSPYIRDLTLEVQRGRVGTPSLALQIESERVASVPSMIWGLAGPTYSVSSACASGITAINAAIEKIRSKRAKIMLAGGTEGEVNDLTMAMYERTALAKETEPSIASRPFHKKRNGFVPGEGAGVLVIEELEHALRRGVVPLAEIIGYADTADGDIEHETDPTQDGAIRAMTIATLGIKEYLLNNGVIFISAHATSTEKGDFAEAEAISKALPSNAIIYIHAPKGQIGHLFGAAGAVEGIFNVQTTLTGIVPPMPYLDDTDLLSGMHYFTDAAQNIGVEIAMDNSFGFGGLNSVLVLEKYRLQV